MILNPYLLQFISGDTSDVFSFADVFVITSIDGLEASTNVETANRFDGLGGVYLGSKVEPLNITIKGVVLGKVKQNKKILINTFQPKASGYLLYDRKYRLDVYITRSPAPERYISNNAFEIEFCAVYPFWSTAQPTSITAKGILKEFKLPYNFNIPFILGRYVDYNDIYNTGNVQSEYVIKMSALSDMVKNPKVLQQATGEFLRLFYTFSKGDNIMIDTRRNQLRAYKCNDYWYPIQEISDKIDINSTPFKLYSGSNVIKLSCDNGFDDLLATIEFSEIVAGVY